MKSDKERYIRDAAIDIVSSAGIRNIYPAERVCEAVSPHSDVIQEHTIFTASDIKQVPSQ